MKLGQINGQAVAEIQREIIQVPVEGLHMTLFPGIVTAYGLDGAIIFEGSVEGLKAALASGGLVRLVRLKE